MPTAFASMQALNAGKYVILISLSCTWPKIDGCIIKQNKTKIVEMKNAMFYVCHVV